MINCGPLHYGLPLLLTGGMKPELIERYVEAGMLVAVAGFDLILGKRYHEMQKKPDWTAVAQALRAYVKAFADARAKCMSKVNFESADPVVIQKQSGKFLNV
jgi:hypothetical protein